MSDGPAAVIVNEAGTNVAEVKAASTAAVAGDKALVVAVSPNNTVPVSAASLPLPTGAATSALQTQPGVDIGDVTVNNAAGAAAVNIQDGGNSITVDATSLPLPTGAATEATLAAVSGKLPATLGQKAMAASLAVVVASDQSAVPVSAASLPLPAGAATEATLAAQTLADNAAFTDGTSQVTPAGYIFDEVAGTALAENDVAAARVDSKRAVVHVIEDATTRGQRMAVTAANAAKVDGSAVTQPISAASLPLPSGAATEATLATRLADATFTGRINTLGQKTMANSTPVVLASDQTVIPVSDNGGSLTVDTPQLPAALVGGRLDVVVGAALPAGNNNIGDVDVVSVPAPLSTSGGGTEATALRVTIASDSTGLVSVDDNGGSLTVDTPQLPAALVGGRLDGNVGAWLGSTAPTVGQKTLANSVPVAVASDQVINVEGRAANGAAVVGNPVLVGGSDGTDARSLLTDNTGRIVIAPVGAGVTRGFAAGEAVLAATTIVPIRSTTYTEQAANATRSVSSASANDTSAGTGARTLRITYYTVTMTGPFTTDVTLNGVTAVATSVSDICFIEKIEVLTVGSTGSNVGIITLFVNNAGGGGTIWTIAATANQTKGAHHYCPTGVTCYITGLLVGIKGADTTAGFLRAKNPTVAAAAEIQISDVVRAPSSGQSFRAYGTAIPVPGPARITVFAAPDSSSSRTYYGSFDYYEE